MSDDDIKPLPTWEAQDREDGRALRELREAYDDSGWHPIRISYWTPSNLPTIDLPDFQVELKVRARVYIRGSGDTIADACRAALEARK